MRCTFQEEGHRGQVPERGERPRLPDPHAPDGQNEPPLPRQEVGQNLAEALQLARPGQLGKRGGRTRDVTWCPIILSRSTAV